MTPLSSFYTFSGAVLRKKNSHQPPNPKPRGWKNSGTVSEFPTCENKWRVPNGSPEWTQTSVRPSESFELTKWEELHLLKGEIMRPFSVNFSDAGLKAFFFPRMRVRGIFRDPQKMGPRIPILFRYHSRKLTVSGVCGITLDRGYQFWGGKNYDSPRFWLLWSSSNLCWMLMWSWTKKSKGTCS